ncbi:hypothetical protein D3C80_1182660 [compost metagenome]
MTGTPGGARGGGGHHADEGERIHLDYADEDEGLGHGRQHALTVEGARQQAIVDQLELLVAGGLDREAADPKGVEKVGDEADGRHRPEGGGLQLALAPLVPPGVNQHENKDQGAADKQQAQKSDKHRGTSSNGRRF